MRQKHEKFFTAEPENQVGLAQGLSSDLNDFLQDPITDLMAIGIIHVLEMVQIEQKA